VPRSGKNSKNDVKSPKKKSLTRMEVKVNFEVYGGAAKVERHNPHRAEPGATANDLHCHGLCSEQHTPRQARSSLSLNVRQKMKLTELDEVPL
jgi:hypothetical protein